MPRYFFHLVCGGEVIPDRAGVDVADAASAYRVALESVKELRASGASRRRRWENWQFVIVEASGRTVATLPINRSE